MLKVRCETRIWEVNGEDRSAVDGELVLYVTSHWNRSEWVVLKAPGLPATTVDASQLRAAIDNCTNTRRFG